MPDQPHEPTAATDFVAGVYFALGALTVRLLDDGKVDVPYCVDMKRRLDTLFVERVGSV